MRKVKLVALALLVAGLLTIPNIALAGPFDGAWQTKLTMGSQIVSPFLVCDTTENGTLCIMLKYEAGSWWGFSCPQLEGDKLSGKIYDILTPGWYYDFSIKLTTPNTFDGVITCFDPGTAPTPAGNFAGQKIW